MPNIRLLCVGKLKEKYLVMAQDEYAKRLSAFCRLEIIEKRVRPMNPPQRSKSPAEESQTLLSAYAALSHCHEER